MANRPPRLLLEMLTFKRPYGSNAEEQFIKRFIEPLGAERDAFGNYMLRIGDAPVIWSCHTDSVHYKGGRQNVTYGDDNVIRLHGASKEASKNPNSPNCLGADDAAGVWIMSEMIRANVPGLYVFHRGEECGGLGSGWLIKNHPEITDGIKYAIAFDRRGTNSIITHQGGGMCCSDEFAWDFSYSLGDFGTKYGHAPDSTGLYTDTAEYVELVPECTNISVGYQFEHGWKEQLDANYLVGLRDAMLAMTNIGQWTCKREPGDDGWGNADWSKYYSKDNEPRGVKICDAGVSTTYYCTKCDTETYDGICECYVKRGGIPLSGYEAPSRYLGSHAMTDAEFVETEKLDPAWEAWRDEISARWDGYMYEEPVKRLLQGMKGRR